MKEVSVSSFQKALQSEAGDPTVDFINVCSEPEYEEKCIPGVRCVPLDKLHDRLGEFKGKKKVYVHCNSGNRSRRAVQLMEDLGVDAELINVEGGLMAWDKAGLPVESQTVRMPIMRQVMLAAGLLILAGYALALIVHPNFIFLSILVGVGLTFSGLTGRCLLRYLIAKAPWNQ